jgi:uncharacterized coiled-coil DUF342 family protein
MADTREFFDENLVGLSDPENSDPEKYNLYGGLAEMADELSALHDQVNKLCEKADELSALPDQMNKLSEKADELSALPDQMNKLEAVLAEIGRDMRELKKSLRVARAAPRPPESRIRSRRRQPASDVRTIAP